MPKSDPKVNSKSSNIKQRRYQKLYIPPILIDQRRFVSIIAVIVVLMAGFFTGGYLLGYQQAESESMLVMDTIALSLPDVKQTADYNFLFSSVESNVVPGVDRDVDLPDVNQTNISVDLHSAAQQPEQLISDPNSSVEEEKNLALQSSDEVQIQDIAIGGPHASLEDDPLIHLADNADKATAKYTIQVGLYGSADNAERKVEDLLAKRLNAYSTAYIDKKKQQLYNVRFGYYASYKRAKLALDTYQAMLSNDGYIIKLKH